MVAKDLREMALRRRMKQVSMTGTKGKETVERVVTAAWKTNWDWDWVWE